MSHIKEEVILLNTERVMDKDSEWTGQDEEVCKHCTSYYECHFPSRECNKYQMIKVKE